MLFSLKSLKLIVLLLFATVHLRAAEVWVAEQVAPVGVLPSNPTCGYPYVAVNDLAFDSQNRAVLAWSRQWGCGGDATNHWARRIGSNWETHGVRALRFDGGARMALRPTDDHPFLLFRGYAGNDSLGVFQSDLDITPDGTASYIAFIGSYASRCSPVEVRPRFFAGETNPRWLTYLPNNRDALGCALWLNGATLAAGNFGGADFAIGPDGRNHVLYRDDSALVYNPGVFGAGIIVTNNCHPSAQSVSIVVDSSNRIHAVVAGVGALASLYYFASPDGTNWVGQHLDSIGRAGFGAVIALDRMNVPAVAWLRADGIYVAQQSPDGTWTKQLVRAGNFATDVTVQNLALAFDPNNQPSVAVYDPCSRSVLALTRTSVVQVERDLEVTQSIPPTPTSLGTLLPHIFSLRNLSDRNAHNVRLTVTFPPTASIAFTSIAPQSRTGNSMTFSLGDFVSFCGAEVEVRFNADKVGAFSVTASVTGEEPDGNPDNNSVINIVELRPASCFAQVAGAVGRWPGDTDARDIVGSINGKLRGDVAFLPGIIGNAFSLNGTNAFIELRNGPEFNPSGSFAISAWIQPRGGGAVFGKYECGGGFCRGNALYHLSLSATTLYYVVRDSAGGSSSVSANYDFSQARFYHVVSLRDIAANELRVFVDGTMVTNVSLTGGATGPVRDLFVSDGDDPLLIGAFPNINAANGFFKGEIDDFTYYDRALSPAEVQTIFGARGAVECVGPMFATEKLPDGTLNLQYSNQVEVAFGAKPYQLGTISGALPPGVVLDSDGALSGRPLSVGQFPVTLRVTDALGYSVDRDFLLRITECAAANGLLAWWAAEGNANDLAYTNHGTLQGGALFATGYVGGAFKFANGSHVQVPDSTLLRPENFTLAAWVKPESASGVDTIMAKGSTGLSSGYDGDANGWFIGLDNGKPQFGTGHRDGLGKSVMAPVSVPLNQWSHVAATFDGAIKRLYVNGAQAASSTNASPIQYDPLSVPVTIGEDWRNNAPSGVYPFDGLIDEVAIFDRALSPDEFGPIMLNGFPGTHPITGPPFIANPAASGDLPFATVLEAYSTSISNRFCGVAVSHSLASGALPVGLNLNADGTITGAAIQVGRFSFTVRAVDSHGRFAVGPLRLEVRSRAPQFVHPPSDRELELHQALWLTVQTDIPAQLQWYFNAVPLTGETNQWLIRTDFAASQAGLYHVYAFNSAGGTVSPPATVVVLLPPAARNGVSVSTPVILSGNKLCFEFTTQPGRMYRVESADGDALGGAWDTRERVVATGLVSCHIEDILDGVDSRFIRIVEEPLQPPQQFGADDQLSFVPLDSTGTPQRGGGLITSNGVAGAFQFRVGGHALAEGLGLIIEFPDGGTVTETNGETSVQFRRATFQFGPDSPLQFEPRVLELNSSTNLTLVPGRLTVEQLEQLLGKPAGSGLEVVAFESFQFTLLRGTFDENLIRGVRIRLSEDAALSLALPTESGDLPDFSLELNPRGKIQIPFWGSFPLPDLSGTPATLTVSPARPVILELGFDRHVGISGHAEVNFGATGGKFGVDFSFSDPEYRLRIAANKVALPPLLSATDLLPNVPELRPATDDAALRTYAQRLDWAECATANFSVLAEPDASGPETMHRKNTPVLEPGSAAMLDMWRCIALSSGLGIAREQILEAVRRTSRTAASSEDFFEIARSLAMLAELQQKLGPNASVEFQTATDEAAAALQRKLKDNTLCANFKPLEFTAAFSNLLYGATILQALNHPRADDLREAAGEALSCFANGYLERLVVTAGLFINPSNSPIAKMPRYEALEHLGQLLTIRKYAQGLGIVIEDRAPIREGLARLALRIWDELRGRMENAIASNDRRTYLYLFAEVQELIALVQTGVLPDRIELQSLPTAGELESLVMAAFQNGPVEIVAVDAYGERLPQLRDDLRRFVNLLSSIPPVVMTAPFAVQRNVDALEQRLTRVLPFLSSRTTFANGDIVAALEAGLLNEEIRLRFGLGTSAAWRTDQLNVVTRHLVERAGVDMDWGSAHLGARMLLAAERRAARNESNATDPALITRLRADRRAYLIAAHQLLNVEHTVAVLLWNSAESRRNGNLGLRLADMVLPGGVEIDRAAGELRYDARAKSLSGAFSGSMRLPNSGLGLEILNASFHSGGALDVSLIGSLDIPSRGALVRLEIPRRHPLHFSLDRNHQIMLAGGLLARLQNGMEFEAWASMSDPWYTFGAAARGIRFELATNLTVSIHVPDPTKLAQLPDDLQPLVLDYLAASAATLQPLRSLNEPLQLEPLGSAPEFSNPQVSGDLDTIVAGAATFRLMTSNSVALGFATIQDAETNLHNLARKLERDLNRASANLRREATAIVQAQQEADEVQRKARRLAALCALLEQAGKFTNQMGKAYNKAGARLQGGHAGLLQPQFIAEKMQPVSDALHAAMADPESMSDPRAAEKIALVAATLERVKQGEGLDALPDYRAETVTFLEGSRAARFRELGLNSDGTINGDGARLGEHDWERLNQATEEFVQQEYLLTLYGGQQNGHFANAASSIYTARRNQIADRIRTIKSTPLRPPHDHPSVRQMQVVLYALPLILEADLFSQQTGVGGQTVTVQQPNGAVLTTNIAGATSNLLAYINGDITGLATFMEKPSNQKTPGELRTFNEVIRPELNQWMKQPNKGTPYIVAALRGAFTKRNQPVPSPIQRVMTAAIRERIPVLSTSAAVPGALLTAADATQRFADVVALAELIDLAAESEAVKSQLLGTIGQSVLPKFRVELIGVAKAQEAWWITHRAAVVLNRALRERADHDTTLLRNTLLSHFTLTRDATAEIVGALRDHVKLRPVTLDMKLPGDIVVQDVHGQLTFNRITKYVQGEFGGRLEFPDLRDSNIAIDHLTLDTDGRFDLQASAGFPVPAIAGFTNPRFDGTLRVEGQKSLERSFEGTVRVTGSGAIIGGSKVLSAGLSYTQIIESGQPPRWRLNVSVSGDLNQRFGDNFVLFSAAAEAGTGGGGASGASIRVGGKAGLFSKQLLPVDDALLRPEMFHLVVEDVDFVASTTNNNVATIQLRGGKLRLPQIFGPMPPDFCTNDTPQAGVEISIVPGNPITVTIDHGANPPLITFSGALGIYHVAFPVISGVEAALCSAQLHFASTNLPYLTNITGSMRLPLPNNSIAVVDLSDGVFTLDGLPTGEITLRNDVELFDLAGLKLAAMGSTLSCPTGIEVTRPGGNALPTIRIGGGLRLTLPAEVISQIDGAVISNSVCGELHLAFRENGPPEVSFVISELSFSATGFRLGGDGGVLITNPRLVVSNLHRVMTPTTEHPFVITVSGGLLLPNGPQLSLEDAQLRWFDIARAPDFTFSELRYNEANWTLAGKLPVRVTRAKLELENPLLPFPERYQPANVRITTSIEVAIPPPTGNPPQPAIIGGAVDNLVIEFNPDGTPKPPSIDGFELILAPGKLKLPPIKDLGGRLRLGGLQGRSINDIFIVGELGGSLSSMRLVFNAAFTWQGPLGLCLDVNAGPSGIQLGATPFIISGASGGISFVSGNGDPCLFETYFDTDPITGNKRPKSNLGELAPVMTWEQLRQTVQRMEDFATLFPPLPEVPPDFLNPPPPAPGPTAINNPVKANALAEADSGGSTGPSASAGAPASVPMGDGGPTLLDCPGDCPPPTVNILCQPHPDRAAYPNAVIFKFTAIDEHTITNKTGITRSHIEALGNDGARVAIAISPIVARAITNLVDELIPPVPDLPNASLREKLKQAQVEALVVLYNAVTQTVAQVFGEASATPLYDRFIEMAWRGIPCQDITVAVAGRGSIVGAGAFFYVEGKRVISTAGTDGYVGTLSVLGFPIGEARGFTQMTDENGDPNPSACGQVKVSFGPLELGDLRLLIECRECVTKILGVFPAVARGISEPLLRDILSRIAPQLGNLQRTPRAEMIHSVLTLPAEQRFSVLATFFVELAGQPPEALPFNLQEIFSQSLSPVLREIDPRMTLCGEVAPKLFGFPLTGASTISLGARVNKEGFIGAFSFPPSGYIPFMPPGDRATLSWDLRARDPLFFLAGAVDGRLGTPEAAAEFAREQIDYMLEHTVYAIDYQFHPFGLRVADAGARLIVPNLLDHPAMAGSRWVLPELRGLPSRDAVLLAAAVTNVLGQAFGWHGNTNDFKNIFPEGSPERAMLENYRVDLRKDYFPHGGLLGAGQLALPLMLQENPTNWLSLLDAVENNPDFLVKLTSALKFVTEHVLATVTNGTIAFYLPAPNPLAIYNNHAAPRSLSPQEVIDSIKQFDPAQHLQIGEIYPAHTSFLTGHLSGAFMGVPIGEATLTGKIVRSNESEPMAKLIAHAPADSWIAKLANGGQAPLDFAINIPAPPPSGIDEVFRQITNALAQAEANVRANAPNAIANAQAQLTGLLHAVETNVPKMYFELPLPNAPLLPYPVTLLSPTLYAFSPKFDPSISVTGAVSRARHDGGVAASTGIDVLEGVISVGTAQLAVTPMPSGLPRFSGVLTGVAVRPPAPFASAQFEPDATAEFDTGANPFVRVQGSVPPLRIGQTFAISPRGGNAIRAGFSVSAAGTTTLELEPVALTVPTFGAAGLLLHGNAGVDAGVIFGTDGTLDARVSFPSPAAARASKASGGETLQIYAPLPGSSAPVVIAEIRGLPQDAFAISGRGTEQATLRLQVVHIPAGITIVPVPVPWPNLPASLREGFSVSGAPGNELSFQIDSSGNFELSGVLTSAEAGSGAFNGFSVGARVVLNNLGLFISGTAFGGSGQVTLNAPLGGTVTFTGELTLGPWSWLNGCITLSDVNGGPFRATAGRSGVQVTDNLKLTLCTPNGGEPQVFIVQAPQIAADGTFCAPLLNVSSINVGAFSVGNATATLCGKANAYANLDFAGTLSLAPVLSSTVTGVVGTEGIRMAFAAGSQDSTLLGAPFENVSASFNAAFEERPNLTVSARLPWTHIPDALRTINGSLGPDGALNLESALSGGFDSLHFAMQQAQTALRYTPGVYAGTAQRGSPAGYWRLDDTDDTARDLPNGRLVFRPAIGGSTLVADRPYRPGTYVGGPARNIPGAFDGTVNRGVLFNGSSQFVSINDEPPFDLSAAVTIEAWFARNNIERGVIYSLVSKGLAWSIEHGSDGRVRFRTPALQSVSGDAAMLESSSTLSDDAWHHVVAVYDGAAKFLYLDGKLSGWQSAYGNFQQNNDPVLIAARQVNGTVSRYFSGRLDDVAIYDRGLSPAEVLDHYTAAGRAGVRFSAALSSAGPFGVPPSLNGLGVSGLLADDGSAALQVNSSGALLDFSGLQTRDTSTSMVIQSGGAAFVIGGQLWAPGLSPNAPIGTARGFLANDGSLNFGVSAFATDAFAGFPLHLTRFNATGNWRTGAGSAATEGDFVFPHNAGTLPFSGEVNTANTTFTLHSSANPTLTLGNQPFTAIGRMTLTDQRLSATGNLKLGAANTSAASLQATLTLERNGDIQGTMSGTEGWSRFNNFEPAVYGILRWNGSFFFNPLGHFETTFNGTFAGSVRIDQQAESRAIDTLPEGLRISSCLPCRLGNCPCPPGTVKVTVDLAPGANGRVTVEQPFGGFNSFGFLLH